MTKVPYVNAVITRDALDEDAQSFFDRSYGAITKVAPPESEAQADSLRLALARVVWLLGQAHAVGFSQSDFAFLVKLLSPNLREEVRRMIAVAAAPETPDMGEAIVKGSGNLEKDVVRGARVIAKQLSLLHSDKDHAEDMDLFGVLIVGPRGKPTIVERKDGHEIGQLDVGVLGLLTNNAPEEIKVLARQLWEAGTEEASRMMLPEGDVEDSGDLKERAEKMLKDLLDRMPKRDDDETKGNE